MPCLVSYHILSNVIQTLFNNLLFNIIQLGSIGTRFQHRIPPLRLPAETFQRTKLPTAYLSTTPTTMISTPSQRWEGGLCGFLKLSPDLCCAFLSDLFTYLCYNAFCAICDAFLLFQANCRFLSFFSLVLGLSKRLTKIPSSGMPRASLRSEKDRWNIDNYRGYIEEFSLFWDRREALGMPVLHMDTQINTTKANRIYRYQSRIYGEIRLFLGK